MLDFNHRPKFAEQVNDLIDQALTAHQGKQVPRDYLGASRLGVSCSRALQFEFTNTPKDHDKEFNGKTLRIFEAGHVFEDLAIKWLRMAGFELHTEKPDGSQFGFAAANGKIKGHVDGIITKAPQSLSLNNFPMLWECKSLNNKSWTDTVKKGVVRSKPVYAAQMAIYQAYMEGSVKGISQNPALFTAINKDTAELHHELVPFDPVLAQKMSDKAVLILRATEAGELLPPISKDPTYFECRFCAWADRCGRLKNE